MTIDFESERNWYIDCENEHRNDPEGYDFDKMFDDRIKNNPPDYLTKLVEILKEKIHQERNVDEKFLLGRFYLAAIFMGNTL